MAGNFFTLPPSGQPSNEDEGFQSTNGLRSCLLKEAILPSPEVTTQAAQGLDLLNRVLLGEQYDKLESSTLDTYSSTVQVVSLVVAPIASYGLRVWDASEPIMCSIAGTISEKSFYSIAKSKFRKAFDDGLIILRADKDEMIGFELSVKSIKFTLQYHQAPLVDKSEFLDVLAKEPSSSVASTTKSKAKMYRDSLYLSKSIPLNEIFPLSFYAIKSWAKRCGIYSHRFGYLEESQLITMVAKSCQRVPQLTTEAIIKDFFAFYSTFRFETDPASYNNGTRWDHRLTYSQRVDAIDDSPAAQEVPRTGLANLAVNGAIVKECLISTHELISTGAWEWSDLVNGRLPGHELGLPKFLEQYRSYIELDVSCWGPSHGKNGRFVNWFDLKVAEFVSSLSSPSLRLRAWPMRVKNGAKASTETFYDVFYLVGVEGTIPPGRILETDRRLRADRNYDSRTCFFDIGVMSNLPIHDIVPDDKDWGLIADAENPDSSDDEEDTRSEESSALLKKKSKSKSKIKREELETPNPSPEPKRTSLRPALDILNRIIHDPEMDTEDFSVGYLDRIAGIKEMPVSWWKAEDITAEDFIPQSRIRYFKRKGNGVVVWDRESRVDLVFGSGLPSTKLEA